MVIAGEWAKKDAWCAPRTLTLPLLQRVFRCCRRTKTRGGRARNRNFQGLLYYAFNVLELLH